MANIIKAHEIKTLNFTFLKTEYLKKKVNNKTIETWDAGHQTSRAEAECQKSLNKL